jgi:hypothetical protein
MNRQTRSGLGGVVSRNHQQLRGIAWFTGPNFGEFNASTLKNFGGNAVGT